jgi:hypothetical protein
VKDHRWIETIDEAKADLERAHSDYKRDPNPMTRAYVGIALGRAVKASMMASGDFIARADGELIDVKGT